MGRALALAVLALAVLEAGACQAPCSCLWQRGKWAAQCARAGLVAPPDRLGPEVQVLDLSDNLIGPLEGRAFADRSLVNLQQLNLSRCGLHSMHEDTFHSLELLVSLDLSHNRLETVEARWFEATPRLRHLRLDGNHVALLRADSFAPLALLSALSLNECGVRDVETGAFRGLKKLHTLELAGNDLRQLDVASLAPLRTLEALNLARNPWQCSCALAALQDLLRARYLQAPVQPTCMLPEPCPPRDDTLQ